MEYRIDIQIRGNKNASKIAEADIKNKIDEILEKYDMLSSPVITYHSYRVVHTNYNGNRVTKRIRVQNE